MTTLQASSDPVLAWLQSGWAVLTLGVGFVGAVIVAWRNWLAAERDRRALKQDDLEREKLQLELNRLRNDPSVVADRRAIYERLRKVVNDILKGAKASPEDVYALHDIRHDCEFRFPPEIVASIKQLIKHAIDLHITVERMQWFRTRPTKPEEWSETSEQNHKALTGVTSFYDSMIDAFRPYLSL